MLFVLNSLSLCSRFHSVWKVVLTFSVGLLSANLWEIPSWILHAKDVLLKYLDVLVQSR